MGSNMARGMEPALIQGFMATGCRGLNNYRRSN